MKVKLLQSVMTASGAFAPGAVIIVDDVIARSWITAKLAIACNEPVEHQVMPGPREVKVTDELEDDEDVEVAQDVIQREGYSRRKLGYAQNDAAHKRRLRR